MLSPKILIETFPMNHPIVPKPSPTILPTTNPTKAPNKAPPTPDCDNPMVIHVREPTIANDVNPVKGVTPFSSVHWVSTPPIVPPTMVTTSFIGASINTPTTAIAIDMTTAYQIAEVRNEA
jgi:hypothetical protein